MENKKLTDSELEQVSGGDVTSANIVGRGKNGNPILTTWECGSAVLTSDPEHPGSGNVSK